MRYKEILFALALVILTLIIWQAIDVFFLAFATILLAIFLNAIGRGAKKILHLPYIPSLFIALVTIAGVFVCIFWLYSPLITEQFELLVEQLPQAIDTVDTYLPLSLDSLEKEISIDNEKLVSGALSIFSATVNSIVSFVIFLVVGFYLAILPNRYLKGVFFVIPEKKQERAWKITNQIGHSLRFWLLGKVLSMIAVGLLSFIGLWLLDVSLAVILGVLAGLLTFIPYVGPILAAIPAVLIAFAQNPLLALYVILLYCGVHLLEGYLITPFIEQKTVSIPPALTIMGQILLYVLVGGVGLALASPLIVVCMALIVSLKQKTAPV